MHEDKTGRLHSVMHVRHTDIFRMGKNGIFLCKKHIKDRSGNEENTRNSIDRM